jgi:hypothetical protein
MALALSVQYENIFLTSSAVTATITCSASTVSTLFCFTTVAVSRIIHLHLNMSRISLLLASEMLEIQFLRSWREINLSAWVKKSILC